MASNQRSAVSGQLLRRVLFGLPIAAAVPAAAPAQLLPSKRMDDLVRRVSSIEERLLHHAERIVRLEERRP